MRTLLSLISVPRWLGAALLLIGPALAGAQTAADPPARIAYISLQEGSALIATDGRGSWQPAVLNMPVTTGTRLALEPGARTELHSGWSALRLAGKADFTVSELNDDTTRVALTEGTLSARVRDLQPGERFEINTPNLALVAEQAGEYRIDADPRTDTTRVTVHSGAATVYGEGGQSSSVGARQQLVFSGRSLGMVAQLGSSGRDAFDQWAASRDALDDQSRSARYVSPNMPGYQQLDAWGDWSQDPSYGAVWYPRAVASDWAPYRYGQWRWVEPWGWTWIDDAPWGFAPSHYGRWAQIGPRWAWVPGPRVRQPVYAPALVGFIGGSAGAGAAWFPLAPGERWEPGYQASPRYRNRIDPWANTRERVRPPADTYHFARRPNAITVAPPDHFGSDGGRRPRYTDGSRLPREHWGDTRIVAPPPRAYVPGMTTTAPVAPLPRPETHVNTRPPRFEAERPQPYQTPHIGMAPQRGADRPFGPRDPQPPMLGSPAPQPQMERDRMIHEQRDREQTRLRMQQFENAQQREQQARQLQLQREQEQRVEQQRAAQQQQINAQRQWQIPQERPAPPLIREQSPAARPDFQIGLPRQAPMVRETPPMMRPERQGWEQRQTVPVAPAAQPLQHTMPAPAGMPQAPREREHRGGGSGGQFRIGSPQGAGF